MNRFYTLLAVLLLALAAPCHTFAAPAPNPDDTIVVKLPNQATMTLFVKNKAQLRELRAYKLDSLMLLLDNYITQAEAAGKTAKTETVTMEFYPAKDQPGKQVPEQIRVTVRTDKGAQGDTERVDVVLGRAFGVSIVENGDDDHVSIKVNTSEDNDSIKTARRKAKEAERAARPGRSDFSIDLGLNALVNRPTLLGEEDFDLRPFGSRYISFNWHYRYRLGKQGSPLHLLTGPELAFNNYMFDDNRRLLATPTGTVISPESQFDLEKSKLATTTINLPLLLLFNFSNDKRNDAFRLGAGGFAGYRLGSHTKIKYENDGRTRKDKDRGSFNLNDFQYGVQGVVGIGGLDLFVKYNLNDLFEDNRGPQAQTLSFGVSLLN